MNKDFEKSTTTTHTPDTIDPAEFAVAEKEAAASDLTHIHVFRQPFTYEGKTYETLTFDFGKLTGNDGIAIQEELDAIGKPVLVPAVSANYLLRMAARACVPPIAENVIRAMPLFEFNKITGAARSFLLKSGL